MKKIALIASFVFALGSANAQNRNTLLQGDFWKQKPSVDAVKAEIAKGSNPAESDQRAFDATSMAINADAPLETIKFLLDQPGNPVTKGTHHSRTYLHWASARGNVDLVNELLKRGSDKEKADSYGTPVVAYAASTGQANTALYDTFFKLGIDAKKKYANGANLLLLSIAGDKDLKLVDYFTSKGMSIKDVDADGATAFDYAARSGDINFLKTILAKGAKPTNMALSFASQGGRMSSASLELYKYLVEDLKLNPTATNKEGNNVLHNIVRRPNQEEVINYFLAKGVDVNKANEEGNTVFMTAAGGRNVALLELLAPKVKDINAVNKKGESALTQAVSASSPEVVAYLIGKGANVKVEDAAGNNLAYYLVQSYRPAGRPAGPGAAPSKDEFAEKLALLTAKGLDVNAAQKDGSTLYHVAIARLDLALLKRLTDLKINVNAKNKEGNTVLHRAALISKDDEILKYLLSIGADKAVKTDFDETAYDLAAENKFLSQKNISVSFLK
jgi:ankyrin repeat protein